MSAGKFGSDAGVARVVLVISLGIVLLSLACTLVSVSNTFDVSQIKPRTDVDSKLSLEEEREFWVEVQYSDSETDVTYKWEATAGEFPESDSDRIIRYKAPSMTGLNTITVTVTANNLTEVRTTTFHVVESSSTPSPTPTDTEKIPGETPKDLESPMATKMAISFTIKAEAGYGYIVQGGDWLSKIADDVYDDPTLYEAIKVCNNEMAEKFPELGLTHIENVNFINVDDRFWLPPIEQIREFTETINYLVPIDPRQVNGDIMIDGSSTVGPITQRIVELFIDEGFDGRLISQKEGVLVEADSYRLNVSSASVITNNISESDIGLALLCNQEVYIANASRPINADELELCQSNGINESSLVKLKIGADSITIIVKNDNNSIGENVTLSDLRNFFSFNTSSSPDIRRHIPKGGTFDVFMETVFSSGFPDDCVPNESINYHCHVDDDDLAEAVSSDSSAIGFVGYGYYSKFKNSLRSLKVHEIRPEIEGAHSGYLLRRDLYIYTTVEIIQQNHQVRDFINFYLTHVSSAIQEVGFFPASRDVIQESQSVFAQAANLNAQAPVYKCQVAQ